MTRRLFTLAAAISLLLCALLIIPARRGSGITTAAQMEQSLCAEIPVGTPTKEARISLEKRRFQVSKNKGSYPVQGQLRELDYLYGFNWESRGLLSFARLWEVVVKTDNGRVLELHVRSSIPKP
jgi:hypothetical protein